MFKKVLIANRGEIALRGIRACQELGIVPVAVYSEADKHSLHVQMADEAICIGDPKSYLDDKKLIKAAKYANCTGLFPGYGYLSEDAKFAKLCSHNKIRFIGPTATVIRNMGDKSEANRIMEEANVPVLPGSKEPLKSSKKAAYVADEIGYPVMIKAVAGGGGKGMRIAQSQSEFDSMFGQAQVEAYECFRDKRMSVQKYIPESRHIEVQVLGDSFGSTLHVGERECSIQRRHQKLIEEAPSPSIDESVRQLIRETAVRAASRVAYRGAGTVEFIMDEQGKFYFLEMNTRIQVEHPISEMISGVDLVRELFIAASDERLSYKQSEIKFEGHAIECRINAEDPDNNFMPSPGMVERYVAPGGPGVRVDSHLYAGYEIPSFYDSLISKLDVHASDRKKCIARMQRALNEYVIDGISTTISLHRKILGNATFQLGKYTTKFLDYMSGEKRKPSLHDLMVKNMYLSTAGCYAGE